jgi:hypothetical protein
MIKTILAWITGKSDTKAAEVPYKVEAPAPVVEALPAGTEAVMVAVSNADLPAVIQLTQPAVEVATVTVKAKYKKADLNKMTKAQLMELVTKHSLEVKARSTKEELVKVLVKV